MYHRQLILAYTPLKMVTHAWKDVVCGHYNQDFVNMESAQ